MVLHRRSRLGVAHRALAALSLLAVLSACSAAAPPVAATPSLTGRHAWTTPDELHVVSGNVPRTLNPILSTQTVEASINRLTNDLLVSVDPNGAFVPKLASAVPTTSNGGISADGRTITYHLRHGVMWHDGVGFTSRDVTFTFHAIMNPDNDVISRHGYDVVTAVETPDPYTVRFRLRERFAPFVATVFGESDSPYDILPEHLLAKYKSLNDVPYNSAPVGTGPFKFVRWLRGDRIEFVRNDAYYLGAPKIKRIVWRLIPDENTEITALRTHEADWMFEATVNAYKSLKTLPDLRITLPSTNGFEGLLFNTGRAPTSDVHVRRAISMALDRKRLTNDLTYGAALPATGDLPSFMWAFDPGARIAPFSLDDARAELAKSGYGPAHRLTLDLYYEQSAAVDHALSVQVQSTLKDIGLDLQLHSQLSSVIYGGYGAGGTLARGRYQLALYQWFAGIDPDDSAQFVCANRPPHGFNQSFFCSKEMDAAQHDALTNYERPARKAAYSRIQRSLVTEMPLAFLWWPRNVQATNPDLHGFDPNPVVETWNIATWSI